MPWSQPKFRPPDNASALERVVAVLCYLTSGLAGIVYIIISRTSNQSRFFRFHFLQSIILGILAILVGWAKNAFEMITAPAMASLGSWLHGTLAATGDGIMTAISWLIMAILGALFLLPFYGAIMAALGKTAEIPYISDVVRQQL